MKPLPALIMRGHLFAAGVAVATGVLFWWIPPVGIISGATIALVTLRRGSTEGLILISLTALLAASFFWLAWDTIWPMLAVFLTYWLSVWLLALVLRMSLSLTWTFMGAALLALSGVAVFYLALGDPSIWWVRAIEGFHRDLSALVMPAAIDRDILEQLMTMMKAWAPLLPGQIVSAGLLFILLAILLGRWWQALLFNPGGFRKEFHELRLGRLLASVMLALSAGAVLSGWPLLINCLLVLSIVYTLQGAALVHALVFNGLLSPLWLLVLYLFLIPFLSQWVVAVSIADAWFDFRARFRSRLDKLRP